MNDTYIHTYIHIQIYIHTYVCHGLIQSAVIKVWGPADFGVISLITFIWHNLQVMIIHVVIIVTKICVEHHFILFFIF
jgi:hypothetical protein